LTKVPKLIIFQRETVKGSVTHQFSLKDKKI